MRRTRGSGGKHCGGQNTRDCGASGQSVSQRTGSGPSFERAFAEPNKFGCRDMCVADVLVNALQMHFAQQPQSSAVSVRRTLQCAMHMRSKCTCPCAANQIRVATNQIRVHVQAKTVLNPLKIFL